MWSTIRELVQDLTKSIYQMSNSIDRLADAISDYHTGVVVPVNQLRNRVERLECVVGAPKDQR